jgi:cytochrome d ubiquinol oxidase subunit II
LVTLGGISFGAWSLVYATLFSGLYTGMLILLFGLFLRPVGFDYRSKLTNARWRSTWDWALFFGGFVPAVVLSLAAGNLMIGLPFKFDNDFRSHYTGHFLDLLQPFALLTVIVGVSLFCLHGAVFLHWRTEALLAERARRVIIWSGLLFLASFIMAGIWVALDLEGYRISSAIDTNIVNNLLAKIVIKENGLWMTNYSRYPGLMLSPMIAILGTGLVLYLTVKCRSGIAFLSSSLVVMCTIITAAGSMFPFIMPSITEPSSSLTIWDASASYYTLHLLFFVTVIMMPVVIGYTLWVYRIMRGKVTIEDIETNRNVLY